MRQVAGKTGELSAHSTIGDWCAGRSLPSLASGDLFLQVVQACGVSDSAVLEEWHQAWLRVRRAPGRPPGQEPYRGLASFQAEDAGWFFGRQALTGQLAGRLADLDRAGGGLQLVVGPSGAGKSSLLRAGLIPALGEGGPGGAAPRPSVLLTPGPCPAGALTEALGRLAGDLASQPGPEGRDGEGGGAPGDGRPVIVVDQLEEAFAPYVGQKERQMFVEALSGAARGLSAALVVLGLRADCYAEVLRYPQLAAAVPGQLVVGPMTEAELREAITAPARKARIEIEDGLVELLLREVAPRSGSQQGAYEAGVLPLLSHALYATWEHGGGRRMTVAGYREVGGIEGAVAASADAAFRELTSAQREVARRMFLRLVWVAADMADTRRRAAPAELRAACGAGRDGELDDVLDRFVAARLVTVSADTVEISHEALLTAWPQLGTWLDTDRAGLVTGRQLHDAADSWQREDRDPASLYRGTRLAAASEWAARQDEGLPPLAAEFLIASSTQREEEGHRARRRARRRYQVGAVLAALVVAAASAGIYARQVQVTGDRDRAQALSRLVADEASRLRARDLPLSAQLALAAYRISPTPEARSSLLSATAFPAAARAFASSGQAESAAISPDGRHLAAGTGEEHSVYLWNITSPARPVQEGPPLAGPASWVNSVSFSPDGTTLAAGSSDNQAWLFNLRTRQASELPHPAPVTATIYRGHSLVTVADDGSVRIWSLPGPVIDEPRDEVFAVSWDATGRELGIAPGAVDNTLSVWNVTDPGQPVPQGPLLVNTSRAAFSGSGALTPDGRTFAGGATDGTIQLWDISNHARPARIGTPFPAARKLIEAVAISSDGHTLAAASDDGAAHLIDITSPRRPAPLATLPGQAPGYVMYQAAFSPDGRLLAAASQDGHVYLWDIANRRRPRLLTTLGGLAGAALTAAFSSDGHTLAAGDSDGTIQLWDVTDPGHPASLGQPLTGPVGYINSVAFDPAADILAAGSGDDTTWLWDLTQPRQPAYLATLTGPAQAVFAVAFSPDGQTLAAGSQDHTVRLWDTSPQTAATRICATTGTSHHANGHSTSLVTHTSHHATARDEAPRDTETGIRRQRDAR